MALTYGYFDHINRVPSYNADEINYLFNGVIQDGIFNSARDAHDNPVGTFETTIHNENTIKKNYLVNDMVPGTYAGLTLSKDSDGVITANGRFDDVIVFSTGDIDQNETIISELTLPAGNYWVSDGKESGKIRVYNKKDYLDSGRTVLAYSNSNNKTFILNSETTVYVFFYYDKKTRYNNEQFYPMIKKVSDIDPTFIPCGTEIIIEGTGNEIVVGTGKALFNGIWVLNGEPIVIPFDEESPATRNHEEGDQFIYKGSVCTSITNISEGDSLILNTNYLNNQPKKLFYVAIEVNKKLVKRDASIKIVWGTDSTLPPLKNIPYNKFIIETNDRKVFQYAIAKRSIKNNMDIVEPVEFNYVNSLLEDPNIQVRNNLTTTNPGYVLDARQAKVLNDKTPFPFAIRNDTYGYIKNNVFIPF